MALDIEGKLEGENLLYSLKGRLDTNTAPELEEKLEKEVSGAVKNLTLDLKELDYISSAGLRVLLGAQKKMSAISGEMKVKNPNDTVMEVFEVTGFLDVLSVE